MRQPHESWLRFPGLPHVIFSSLPFVLRSACAVKKVPKKKVPRFGGLLSYLLFFFNNAPLLKSPWGFKKVVIKVKCRVVNFHVVSTAVKDKSNSRGLATGADFFCEFFLKLMIVSQSVTSLY